MSTYTIYSQQGRHCDYCAMAENYLKRLGIPYTRKDLETTELLAVADAAGMTTVPIIYGPDDDLIGGFDDLRTHFETP